ncbi:MAG TPA: glutamate ABC transporter substrate-binding protein [Ilumatobacteraceae bacterium]|nr:glutamate ABC transporter substrate-binding protein [Ilumatobacteraceae bacterium]HRB02207.1 glutamate ABC transporter substrate-binding protein [Ilumatobacteraceae bacterium]
MTARSGLKNLLLGALPVLMIAGCASGGRLPSAVEGSAPTTTAPPAAQEFTCPAGQVEPSGVTPKSYAPDGPLPSPDDLPDGSTMAAIRDRGALRIGVSADTLLFGARNPLTGKIEGFDIDMLKEVAKAIFGVDDAVAYNYLDFVVIPYSQRLPKLRNGDVDIVAHTMTINCVRWQQIAFSSEYYRSGQRVLVDVTSQFGSIDELDAAGATVCVPDGSTNLENLAAYPGLTVVALPDVSDCLVALQAGEVQAITGDDTVMAGLNKQDPATAVVGDKFSFEPYGLGMPTEHVDFVKFVNALLEEMRTDGRWQSIYDRWLLATLGAQTPPDARYGRQEP